ncbi:MAG: hypothetical protein AAFR96_13270, partial [Planctomycetota bacterium]
MATERHTVKRFDVRLLGVTGLVIAAGTACAQTDVNDSALTGDDDIWLLDYDNDDFPVMARKIGEFNTYDGSAGFLPDGASGTAYETPYGDRVGYEGSGVGDVDGDGFDDWCALWYDAEPTRDANFYGTGLSRIVTGASVVPFRLPDATDANGDPIVTGALGTGSGF